MWGEQADVTLIDESPDLWRDSIQSSPIKVMDDVLSMDCQGGSIAVIKKDRSLWMWGSASSGKLGNGETEGTFSPTRIMDDVVMVSCVGSHTAAVKADGSLWLFGSNLYGQIGNGWKGNVKTYYNKNENWVYPLQTVPEKVMDDVVYVDCGGGYTAAIKKDGTLWVWGGISTARLGMESALPGRL